MMEYERSYRTGRSVLSFVEIFSWLVVFTGIIVALAGFASGGAMGLMGRPSGIARVLGVVPGILISWGGIVSVLFAQTSRAGLDTAEMTRDMLQIMRGEKTSFTENTADAFDASDLNVDASGEKFKFQASGTGRTYDAWRMPDGSVVVSGLAGKKRFRNEQEANGFYR